MKKLSDCRVLLVDDAKANLDILVEGLKPDHKLSLALNGEMGLSGFCVGPNDTIYLVMRLYWPKPEPSSILAPGEGTWKPPGLQRVE
jgi:hypothetical protein